LAKAFEDAQTGKGIVVCLPENADESCVKLLLEGARQALNDRQITRFALVQNGGGAASFAKTLHLEAPWINTVVVDTPFDHPNAVEWVIDEASAVSGFVEAYYDSSGTRFEPRLQLLEAQCEAEALELGVSDVLLVTGGGKGIAAECALSIARETGVRLGLLGRSQPSDNEELAANLRRMDMAGVVYRYIPCDITDVHSVKSAVAEIEAFLGPVTAIIHGAGANVPRLLNDLDESHFVKTLRPKVQGARNVLDAVDVDKLRLFVTFGSIIARTGMKGEADYAVANEWLTRLTGEFQSQHPQCRCAAVEWSVWSGVGMGERLGRIDALVNQGISPISPDEGVTIMRELIAHPPQKVAVVVTGRYGDSPTLGVDRPDLPLLRFLERPRTHYPGVELVVDTELSVHTDPYLNDHVLQSEKILPGVMGLEAVAQAAMALMESDTPPVFESVKFIRPVVVPDDDTVTLRVAALVTGPNRVKVVVRSSRTDFQIDHFQATCVFGSTESAFDKKLTLPCGKSITSDRLPIDPKRDLYGNILFHKGRFQRLEGYSHLRARECIAEISADGASSWFVQYLPGEFTLGDPAARDAAIHAIQSCIPQATLLPTGVERISSDWSKAEGLTFVYARERLRDGGDFTYDIEIADDKGQVYERWEGLHLHMMSGSEFSGKWPEPLLGPYIERKVSELIPGVELAVGTDISTGDDRKYRSEHTIKRLLGNNALLEHRPDGKPELHEVDDSLDVSISHSGDVTLVIAGTGRIGCDVEPVTTRSTTVWKDLLGLDGFKLAEYVSNEAGEGLDPAATRVWSAIECLKKSGASVTNACMSFKSSTNDGWVTLSSGHTTIATLVCNTRNCDSTMVFAALARGDNAGV
jgi:enediyne polyketide synthase